MKRKKYLLPVCLIILGMIYCREVFAQLTELGKAFEKDTAAINTIINAAYDKITYYPDSAEALFKEAGELSRHNTYRVGIRRSLTGLGQICIREGQYNAALIYFFEAIRYCDTLNDRKLLSQVYNSIGIAYFNQVKLEQAAKAYTRAVAYGDTSPDEQYRAYLNLGATFNKLRQYEQALAYYRKALEMARQNNDISIWTGILANMGSCFQALGEYGQSEMYVDSALNMARKHNLYREEVAAIVALCGLYKATGRPEQALYVLKQGLHLADMPALHARDRNGLLIQAADIYLELRQYKSAERYLMKAQAEAGEDVFSYLKKLHLLKQLYAASGNYQKAYRYQEKFYTLQDSLANIEVVSRINELETKFRTIQKDHTITESRLRLSEQEKSIARQRTWIWRLIAATLLILMLLSWRYLHLRQKNRKLVKNQELEQLKASMEGAQKERARIATELHDGIVSELTAIKMKLDAATYQPEIQTEMYRQYLKELSVIINDVRNTAHNLMPEILLRHGLSEAVGLLCETFQKTGRLTIEYQQYGDFNSLNMEVRRSLYRIIQELLHNIVKHARATTALVQLSCNDGLLTITVEDNGVGIDPEKSHRDRGMGQKSIEQRVQSFNGSVEWGVVGKGQGTHVYVEIEV